MPIWIIIITFLCISAIGVFKAEKLKRRQRTLQACRIFFNRLKRELQYHQHFIDECLHSYATDHHDLFSRFLKTVMANEGTFSQRFNQAIDCYYERLALSKTDQTMLVEFGEVVGSVSLEQQLRHIDFLIQYVEIELQELRGKIDQDVHLYIISALLTGGLVLIFLL